MTEIFAHRGASGYEPENTMESFRLADKLGADGIEFDVHLTKDGIPVIIHDEKIDRTSTGSGYVKDMTLDELRKFNFHGKFPEDKQYEIPTLEQVLDFAKDTKLKINIELKTDVFEYPGIEEKVLKLVYDFELQKRVILSSFNPDSIERVKKQHPEIVTAIITEIPEEKDADTARKTGASALHPAKKHFDIGSLEKIYFESGLDLRVWTLNKEDEIRKFFDKDVTGIFTNYPDKALKVRGNINGNVNRRTYMNKYDIGIFGWWYNMNYGANLTYFSLNRVIQEMGYSVGMVWKGKDPKNLPDSPSIRFANKYYNVGPAFSPDEMANNNDVYDSFLLGSDQLWSPRQEKNSGKEFFFSFVDEEKNKIAYAQSLGRDLDLPDEFIDKYKRLVYRFNGISVREDYAKKMMEKGFHVEVPQVCDPIFLSERGIWDELIDNADIDLPEKYVLNLILDPDVEKMQFCEDIRKKLDESQYLNFTALTPKVPWEDEFGDEPVEGKDGAIENLVKAYSKADYIITDSFHGTCLAIIFNKPFISIANYKRGVGRFESLLRWLKLEDRLVHDMQKPVKCNLKEVDYDSVNEIISASRTEGRRWLEEHLNEKKKLDIVEDKVPVNGSTINDVLDQQYCMGCSACKDSCPVDAISLISDKCGYYRSSVDHTKCIKCGKCISVCPAYKLPQNGNIEPPLCYRFTASDEQVLRKSSSGGFFYTVAKQVISEGGAVVGAAWRDDFSVEHIIVEDMEQLENLQKSKYLQSYSGNCLKKTKELLDGGRKVLFTGTPCQIYGLKAYLGKEYKNLTAIDLLCGNSPSTMFFKKYISELFGDSLKSYEFRHKSDNHKWRAFPIEATLKNGDKVTRSTKAEDAYQSVYHNHTMTPKHCENCRYQKFPRVGDLSIGDFWHISEHEPELNTADGVSIILVNNAKGESVVASIPQSDIREIKKVPLSWMGGNGFSLKGGKNFCSPHRDAFYEAITKMPFSEAVKFALNSNRKTYRDVYKDSSSLLQFDSKYMRFAYEEDFWESHFIDGYPTLIVKNQKWNESRHYARLPLNGVLEKGKKYRFVARFKIKSLSSKFNLHLIGSGSMKLQIIQRQDIKDLNDGNTWIEIDKEIIPDADNYDEFMIGASQLKGEGNFIAFDYINILGL